MSKEVDERVVSMQFDNRHFEKNVSTTISSLDKLKQSLNFSGASKGLESVNSAVGKVNMGVLSDAVETVRARFSALEVMGVTALVNITNSAINAGKKIVSALTIDPIKTGFSEYETQINAIQTILANTESKGTTLDDVNEALDTLNTYADKTIYNFTQMTRNIGTFTAAGIDLDTSVSAIQGIANLAAVSGSTSQQASTAMYQLSQALAAGRVSLMDWNSVVNAGMGGQVFQDALKRTSRAMADNAEQLRKMNEEQLKAYAESNGYTIEQVNSMKNYSANVDKIIEKEGSFRNSLTKGQWLTTDVLTETLKQFTLSAEEGSAEWEAFKKSLMDQGYTASQADDILKMANTATDAATKVKTFTQLWETLKESAQSGWTQTWEIIVGDFEEAKMLLTEVSNAIGAMIGASAEARNSVLKDWKELGGRTVVIESLRNVFQSIIDIIAPIKEAFREVFPPVTGKQIYDMTLKFKEFTEGLKISDDVINRVKSTFKGVFSALDAMRKILTPLIKPIVQVGVAIADVFLSIAALIGDLFTSINEHLDVTNITGSISNIAAAIVNILGGASDGIESFSDIFVKAGEIVVKVAEYIFKPIKDVFGWIAENFSVADIFAGLAGGGIFVVAKKLSGILGGIKKAVGGKGLISLIFGEKGDKDKTSFLDSFKEVLGSVHDSLESFQTGIKSTSILAIAIAIGILSASLTSLSKIDIGDMSKGLGGIGVLATILSATFSSVLKSISKFGSKGIAKSAFSLILIAGSISILANAMKKIGEMSLFELAKGLVGVGAGLAILCKGLNSIDRTPISLKTSIAIIALASACNILGDALTKFAKLSWKEIARGLTAMGGALAELVIALNSISKFGGGGSLSGSASIFIVVESLETMAEGLKSFAQMKWDEIGRGLSAMGGALAELGVTLGLLGKFAGFSSVLGSAAIFIAVQSLSDLAYAFKEFGGMAWDEIGRGLVGMGGALIEVAGITGTLGKLTGFSGILGSGSILIVVQGLADLIDAFKKFGDMTWTEIGKGLAGMGGALTEVAGIAGVLGKIAGFSGILGSGSILIAVQSLGDLANAFKIFGDMSWDQIKTGLVGMGGALTEVGTVSGTLGYLAGLAGILGGASLWVTVQGLGDLADAFKKFGEMSWDEIDRGLTAMAGALTETGLGGIANTLSGLGALSIEVIAEPLGELADSVKKWSDVTVPEGLGYNLANLAVGIGYFTFDGLGASAIAKVAAPLGVLADSVNKWKDVTIPEGLGEKLSSLAPGIEAFTFGGLGAGALAEAAPAVGQMADSIKKWSDVTVPEDLNSKLTGIAEGVKSFTWGFMGGWSIGTIVDPLKNLATSVTAWTGITLPENLQESLTSIAEGVKSFTWGFMGGWSIGTIVDPLTKLPEAIKAWNGVSLPSTVSDDLIALATGIKEFSFMWGADSNLENVSGPLVDIANALVTWGDVSVTDTIEQDLTNIANGVKAIDDVFGDNLVTDITGKTSEVITAVTDMISQINTSISGFGNGFTSLGSTFVQSLSTSIQNGSPTIVNAFSNILENVNTFIFGQSRTFNKSGSELIRMLVNGIKSSSASVSSAILTILSSSISTINLYYTSFYNAGVSLVDGFAAGITDNTWKAEAEAAAMAEASLNAAREKLDINSPSKAFRKLAYSVPEGFAQGIDRMVGVVKTSSTNMAETAINSTKNAISKVGSIVSSDMDFQPTIKPVVDMNSFNIRGIQLSDNINASVGGHVMSLSRMMASAQDNIYRSNNEVISAVNGLREDLTALFTADEKEIALYVDSKKLASTLAKPMNKQLAVLSKKGGY